MRERYEQAVRANLTWFARSGVMDPPDGAWGVAERVLTLTDNDAVDRVRAQFPGFHVKGEYAVLEHRRPDCNFQAALLHLAAAEHFAHAPYRAVGENILAYLFLRSGLRGLGPDADVWQWHNMQWARGFWFDDNGWIAALELYLARRWPELDERFGLAASGRALAAKLRDGMLRTLDTGAPIEHGYWPDPEKYWAGEIRQPHWGAPVCLALALADDPEPARDYFRRLPERLPVVNTSESAYALLAAALAARLTGDAFFRDETARLWAGLAPRLDPYSGTLASEHGEAPPGERVVDLVYTNNWLFAALAAMDDGVDGAAHARRALGAFLLDIQDRSDDPAYDGAWRGMYDRDACAWGGGNRFEGGAGSVYTGWTNAPIALAFLAMASEG